MAADLTYLTTEQGSKLLTSGWWAVSRHPNYLCVAHQSLSCVPTHINERGDLLMGLAWSLPTGFDTPFTYFYVIYFAVLLIHRQRRDDEKCQKKYVKLCPLIPLI
jgi:protein-S-isoprenylcysteine O-methyltransferase Ste14